MLALKSDWHHSKHKETDDVLPYVKQFNQKYVLHRSEIMTFASLIKDKITTLHNTLT